MAAKFVKSSYSRLLCLTKQIKLHHNHSVRTLLSDSYACSEAWATRLQSPILQKINIEDFALKLQDKFDRDGSIAPVDADILANKLEKLPSVQLDFALSLMYRFRHTNVAVHVQDSTPHALIRGLLHMKEYGRLREILKEKIHYGIFLDYFTANILMDHFIEQKMFQEAAEVAYDLMLQEDFVHPITRVLSWYACQLRRKSLQVTTEETVIENQVENTDDEEEVEEDWIKVGYIENPWYDDHFDIQKESQLLGKTLTMVAQPFDNVLGRSYQLIGWGMYEKFDRGLEKLGEWAQLEGVEHLVCQEALDEFQHRLENVETEEPPAESKDPGLIRLEDVLPYITLQQKADLLQQCQSTIESLQSSGKILQDYDLEGSLLTLTKDIVSKVQSDDISEQEQLFLKWTTEREELVQNQLQEYKDTQQKEDIMSKLSALQEREEKIRFFEQWRALSRAKVKGEKKQKLEDLFESEEYKQWAPRT